MVTKPDELYSDQEAARRRDDVIKRMINTPPQLHKPLGNPKAGASSGKRVRLSAEAHVQPFLILFEKLRLLLNQPGIPHGAADSVLQLVEHLNKCFRVKLVYKSAARTGKATIVLEPTDLFIVFVTAFRARDWPQVSVIEHAICSSNAETRAPAKDEPD
jgi:hypothetical protein